MIERALGSVVLDRLQKRPAVAILGARQVGKTTLAHALVRTTGRQHVHLDLQDPEDRALLRDARSFLLAHADELVVIDEIQEMPELFPLLRSLIDRDRRPGRFLLLGSSSPAIVKAASESLTGRITYMDLYPLMITEVGDNDLQRLWLRGGYPEAYLAENDPDAFTLLADILRSFTERDLPALGLGASPSSTHQLLRMLSVVHGNVLNMAMLGRSMGLSAPTIRTYLQFFEQAFFTFTLPSHHVNVRKRLTRAPKVYLTDSGILHTLSNVRSQDDLFAHPARGHSWEGFVVQQIRAWLAGRAQLAYFRTQDGSEMDLVISQGNRTKVAIEIKTTNTPVLTLGNRLAFEAVAAPVQLVITPSARDHSLKDGVQVCSLTSVFTVLEDALTA